MPKTVLTNAEDRMKKSIDVLKGEFAGVRTGRANPAILDRIMVNYYGVDTPVKQLATVNVPEARQLLIKPFDRSTIGAIEKAILNSDLGINPSNDGEAIRLNMPALTEERRKEYVKSVKKMAEDQKVAIRNIRRDANDHLKKLEITEDVEKKSLEDIQKLTDKFIKMIDELTKDKEQDIMTV